MNRTRPTLYVLCALAAVFILLSKCSYTPDPTAKPTQRGDGWHLQTTK